MYFQLGWNIKSDCNNSCSHQLLIAIFSKMKSTRKQYESQKDNFEVIISLTPSEDTFIINIQLTDSRTSHRYNFKINDEYIQAQDPLFISNIESVAELYEHLVSEFDQLTISEHGVIIFEIEVMIKKKLERKAYRIEGERQFSEVEKLRLQVEQMRRQMKKDSERKDQRITQLEQKINISSQEKDRQIQTLKLKIGKQFQEKSILRENDRETAHRELSKIREELAKNNQLIELSKKEIMIHFEEVDQVKEAKIRQMREETERFAEGLAIINRIVDDHEHKIHEIIRVTEKLGEEVRIKEEVQIEKIKKKLGPLRMHDENPHRYSFKVKEQLNAVVISRVGQDGQDLSYFGAEQLKSGIVHSFHIKLCKTQNRFIMAGIGSKKAFGGQAAFKHKQTLTYHAYDGTVFELGQNRKGGLAVRDGSVLTVVIDLKEYRVEWHSDGQMQAIVNISAQMRASPLYLLVVMYNTDDQIHIQL